MTCSVHPSLAAYGGLPWFVELQTRTHPENERSMHNIQMHELRWARHVIPCKTVGISVVWNVAPEFEGHVFVGGNMPSLLTFGVCHGIPCGCTVTDCSAQKNVSIRVNQIWYPHISGMSWMSSIRCAWLVVVVVLQPSPQQFALFNDTNSALLLSASVTQSHSRSHLDEAKVRCHAHQRL